MVPRRRPRAGRRRVAARRGEPARGLGGLATRILFDQGTPAPLRRSLAGHIVVTAYEAGWSNLGNGELIAAAEADAFDLLVTTDQSLRYQQNLTGRRLAILVLPTTRWPTLSSFAADIARQVGRMEPGSYVEMGVP